MRTYLVTGGAGFIGSNYIHYMFKKYGDDIRIINVDKLTYAGNLENLRDVENRDNYTFVRADICDSEAINKIFDENDIDRVVHFAAESHVDRSIRNPEVFVKTNVLGTLVMLNAAKAAWELEDGTFKADKKFLHVSTDEVYGSLENEGEYFYETTPYDPHSPYSASKASSDMLVKAYMDTYKFPANITNCTRQLIGSSQIIVTIRLVRTVERTLFHSTGHDSRTDIGTRHPVVFQIIATNVGADLQP